MTSAALADRAPSPVATLHPETAKALGLDCDGRMVISTDRGKLRVAFHSDDRMARNVVVAPRHRSLNWQALGATRLALAPEQIKPESTTIREAGGQELF